MSKRTVLAVLLLAGLTFNVWTGYRMARIESWGLVVACAVFCVILLAIFVRRVTK
jgi:uncharacterized membrane protein (UPF0136 family)